MAMFKKGPTIVTILIGIDEAGFGPNLGPLAIVASVWESAEEYRPEEIWQSLSSVISQSNDLQPHQIHVADSKKVHQSSKGIGPLERSVSALCLAAGLTLTNWSTLVRALDPDWSSPTGEPWFDESDLSLPVKNCREEHESLATSIQQAWQEGGLKLLGIRARLVPARLFNRQISEWDSKSLLLSRLSLRLLNDLWDRTEPTLIICDKHGARNRYDDLLQEICNGEFIFRIEEGKPMSRYRVGQSELRFQMKAESHFPVAVSSMIAKYLRETSMELFNRFWTTRIPGLKPTKGYPQDAKRFRREIEMECESLGLSESDWWRCR